MLRFHKYHGLGNDFIMVNAIDREAEILRRLTRDKITSLCRTKYGIGADGIILLKTSEESDFGMRLFNSDASEAELSGNGLRCLALYIRELDLNRSRRFSIETGGGSTQVEIVADDRVKVWMPTPVFDSKQIPFAGEGECIDCELEFEGRTFRATVLSIGNPHCVVFESFGITGALEWGPVIENAEYFPQRTNVEFVEVKSPDRIRAIVYERGARITEACGSGACAAVAAGIKTGRLGFNHPVTVETLGGELTVTISKDYTEVILEGEAKKVFEGSVEL